MCVFDYVCELIVWIGWIEGNVCIVCCEDVEYCDCEVE